MIMIISRRQIKAEIWIVCLSILLCSLMLGSDHYVVYAQAPQTVKKNAQESRAESSANVAVKSPANSAGSSSDRAAKLQVSAQKRSRETTRPSGFFQKFLHPMSRAPEENTGRLSDTLVATVPGALLHGLGHWYRGDLDSAQKILLLEGLGILSILGGYTLSTLIEQNSSPKKLSEQWLYHTGGVLLLTSWFADIIGSFRGDLPRRGLRRIEHPRSISMGYRYRDDPQSQHNHHWVAQLNYSTDRLRFSGSLNWESRGQVVGLDGDIMGSIYRHDRHSSNFMSQIELGVRVKRWTWFVDELTQWLIVPQLEGTLGLNHLSSGLRGYALFHRVGLGWERFDLAPLSQSSSESASLLSYPLVMESGLKIHPYSSLIISFSLIEDSTLDMRPKNRDGLFWRGSVFFQQTDQIAINIDTIWGDDWSTWIMLSFSQERER